MYVTRNRAENSGGVLHADNSSIKIERAIHFANNGAKLGGGVTLERYARVYGLSTEEHSGSFWEFMSNVASSYGGALYVNDKTNPDMCMADSVQNTTFTNECFFSTSIFTKLSNNFAGISGYNLFGGPLDRCKMVNKCSHKHEGNKTISLGACRFLSSSNLSESELDTVSSHPVQLCFCRDSQPDCVYPPEPNQVNRGMTFSVELIAYDQIQRAVDAVIHSALNSSAGGLDEGQDIQGISSDCTELQFKIFSPRSLEELTMSIQGLGPCSVEGISQRSMTIEIICFCPIGFQPSGNTMASCDCVCHQVFLPYVRAQCNITSQAVVR